MTNTRKTDGVLHFLYVAFSYKNMISVSSSPFTSEVSLINKESLSTMSTRSTTVSAVTVHAQVLNTQAVTDVNTSKAAGSYAYSPEYHP